MIGLFGDSMAIGSPLGRTPSEIADGDEEDKSERESGMTMDGDCTGNVE